MNGQTCARAYDLETGKELWRCGGQTQRPVASAVAANGLVFIGSGFQGSFLGAFRIGRPRGHRKHRARRLECWIAIPRISRRHCYRTDRLYFHKAKVGDVVAVLTRRQESPITWLLEFPASRAPMRRPSRLGGHVYLTGRSGTTVVIKDSDQLKIVASNSVGETVDATPAPVDNELFIRGENHLFCISE